MQTKVFWKQIIALLLAITFIEPALTWAFEGNNYKISSIFPEIQHLGITVSIPKNLGKVKQVFQGQGKTIVCIQDLHCNYEVQKNIAGIIGHLAKNVGAYCPDRMDIGTSCGRSTRLLVGEEGASQKVPMDVLRDFPLRQVSTEVSDYFVRLGKLTGAEHFAAVGQEPIALEGLETQELYTASLQTVRSFLTSETQGFILDAREALNSLKPGIYPALLQSYDESYCAFQQGNLDLLRYCLFLKQQAAGLQVETAGFPEFEKFVANQQTSFAPDSSPDDLMQELSRLDSLLRERMYTGQDQRELDRLSQRLDLMEKLLNISATPSEVQTFRSQRADFTIQTVMEFIQKHSAGDETGLDPEITQLDEGLKKAEAFYTLADLRSQKFVENLLAKMEQSNQTLAVMVNGGFHINAITEELKRRNISFLSVQPSMTRQDSVNPYFSLLQGKKLPLEKLLEKHQSILSTPAWSLADPLGFTAAAELNIKAIAATLRLTKQELQAFQVFVAKYHLVNPEVETQPAYPVPAGCFLLTAKNPARENLYLLVGSENQLAEEEVQAHQGVFENTEKRTLALFASDADRQQLVAELFAEKQISMAERLNAWLENSVQGIQTRQLNSPGWLAVSIPKILLQTLVFATLASGLAYWIAAEHRAMFALAFGALGGLAVLIIQSKRLRYRYQILHPDPNQPKLHETNVKMILTKILARLEKQGRLPQYRPDDFEFQVLKKMPRFRWRGLVLGQGQNVGSGVNRAKELRVHENLLSAEDAEDILCHEVWEAYGTGSWWSHLRASWHEYGLGWRRMSRTPKPNGIAGEGNHARFRVDDILLHAGRLYEVLGVSADGLKVQNVQSYGEEFIPFSALKIIDDVPGFRYSLFRTSDVVRDYYWECYVNPAFSELLDARAPEVSEEQKWRLYINPAKADFEQTITIIKAVAAKFTQPADFKYLSAITPDLDECFREPLTTKIVLNFSSRQTAMDFYQTLCSQPGYAGLHGTGPAPASVALDSLTSLAQGHKSVRLKQEAAPGGIAGPMRALFVWAFKEKGGKFYDLHAFWLETVLALGLGGLAWILIMVHNPNISLLELAIQAVRVSWQGSFWNPVTYAFMIGMGLVFALHFKNTSKTNRRLFLLILIFGIGVPAALAAIFPGFELVFHSLYLILWVTLVHGLVNFWARKFQARVKSELITDLKLEDPQTLIHNLSEINVWARRFNTYDSFLSRFLSLGKYAYSQANRMYFAAKAEVQKELQSRGLALELPDEQWHSLMALQLEGKTAELAAAIAGLPGAVQPAQQAGQAKGSGRRLVVLGWLTGLSAAMLSGIVVALIAPLNVTLALPILATMAVLALAITLVLPSKPRSSIRRWLGTAVLAIIFMEMAGPLVLNDIETYEYFARTGQVIPRDNSSQELRRFESFWPVRTLLAYQSLKASEDLSILADLQAMRPRVNFWKQRLIDNLIADKNTRHSRNIDSKLWRHTSIDDPREFEVEKIIDRIVPELRRQFPGQTLSIRDEGASSALLSTHWYQHLADLKVDCRYVASDMLTQLVVFQAQDGTTAVFNNAREPGGKLLQIKQGGALYSTETNHDHEILPSADGETGKQRFQAAYQMYTQTGSVPGLGVKTVELFDPQARELAGQAPTRFILEQHNVFTPLAKPSSHLTIISNVLVPDYYTREEMARALAAVGQSTVENGVVLAINESGKPGMSIGITVRIPGRVFYPFTVFQRHGSRLIATEWSQYRGCVGFTQSRPDEKPIQQIDLEHGTEILDGNAGQPAVEPASSQPAQSTATPAQQEGGISGVLRAGFVRLFSKWTKAGVWFNRNAHWVENTLGLAAGTVLAALIMAYFMNGTIGWHEFALAFSSTQLESTLSMGFILCWPMLMALHLGKNTSDRNRWWILAISGVSYLLLLIPAFFPTVSILWIMAGSYLAHYLVNRWLAGNLRARFFLMGNGIDVRKLEEKFGPFIAAYGLQGFQEVFQDALKAFANEKHQRRFLIEHVINYTLPQVKDLVVDRASLKNLGKDLMELAVKSEPWPGRFDNLLLDHGFYDLRRIFGDKLLSYWPILMEIGEAAGPGAGDLFAYGLPAVSHLITDEVSLRRIGMVLAKASRAVSLQFLLTNSKLVHDEAALQLEVQRAQILELAAIMARLQKQEISDIPWLDSFQNKIMQARNLETMRALLVSHRSEIAQVFMRQGDYPWYPFFDGGVAAEIVLPLVLDGSVPLNMDPGKFLPSLMPVEIFAIYDRLVATPGESLPDPTAFREELVVELLQRKVWDIGTAAIAYGLPEELNGKPQIESRARNLNNTITVSKFYRAVLGCFGWNPLLWKNENVLEELHSMYDLFGPEDFQSRLYECIPRDLVTSLTPDELVVYLRFLNSFASQTGGKTEGAQALYLALPKLVKDFPPADFVQYQARLEELLSTVPGDAGYLLQTGLVEAVRSEQECAALVQDLQAWNESGQAENIGELLETLSQTQEIQKCGYSLAEITRLAREIIGSRLPTYVKNFKELFEFDAIRQFACQPFRDFMQNASVELKLRAKIQEHYLELIAVQELLRGSWLSIPGPLEHAVQQTLQLAHGHMQVMATPDITSSKKRREEENLKREMDFVRQGFLQVLLGRTEFSRAEKALLDNFEVTKSLLLISSILATLEQGHDGDASVESRREGKIAREIARRYFDILFRGYHPELSDALETARSQANAYIANLGRNELVDVMAKATGEDPRRIAEDLGQRKANQEQVEELVHAGFDRRLWTTGIEMPVSLSEGITAAKKEKRILQLSYEMVEIALRAGVARAGGQPVTAANHTAVAEILNDLKTAKAFFEEIEKQVANEELHERLVDILGNISRVDAQKIVAVEPQTFQISVKMDFLNEGAAGKGVDGCFQPKGIHREMPIKHGLESNVFFIQVFGAHGNQVANAVVICTPEGAYVYSGYNASGYDMDLAFAKAIMELSRYVPEIYLNRDSAGYQYLESLGTVVEGNVVLTKNSTIFAHQYYDHSPVNEHGDVSVSLAKPLRITFNELKAKGAMAEAARVGNETKPAKLPTSEDLPWEELIGQLTQAGYGQYLGYLLPLVQQRVHASGSGILDGDFYTWFEGMLVQGFNGTSQEVADDLADRTMDFLEDQQWPVGITTPIKPRMGIAQFPAGRSALLKKWTLGIFGRFGLTETGYDKYYTELFETAWSVVFGLLGVGIFALLAFNPWHAAAIAWLPVKGSTAVLTSTLKLALIAFPILHLDRVARWLGLDKAQSYLQANRVTSRLKLDKAVSVLITDTPTSWANVSAAAFISMVTGLLWLAFPVSLPVLNLLLPLATFLVLHLIVNHSKILQEFFKRPLDFIMPIPELWITYTASLLRQFGQDEAANSLEQYFVWKHLGQKPKQLLIRQQGLEKIHRWTDQGLWKAGPLAGVAIMLAIKIIDPNYGVDFPLELMGSVFLSTSFIFGLIFNLAAHEVHNFQNPNATLSLASKPPASKSMTALPAAVRRDSAVDIVTHMRRDSARMKAVQLDISETTAGRSSHSNRAKAEQGISSGNRYATEGNYEAAVNAYLGAVKFDPDYVLGWMKLARAYISLKQPEEAVNAYEQARRIDPYSFTLLNELARVCMDAMQYEKAASILGRIAAMDPDNQEIWLDLGRVYIKLGRFTEAQSLLEKLTSSNQDNLPAWQALEKVYEHLGQDRFRMKAVLNIQRLTRRGGMMPAVEETYAQQGKTVPEKAARAQRYGTRVAWWLEFMVSLKKWYAWAPGIVLGAVTLCVFGNVDWALKAFLGPIWIVFFGLHFVPDSQGHSASQWNKGFALFISLANLSLIFMPGVSFLGMLLAGLAIHWGVNIIAAAQHWLAEGLHRVRADASTPVPELMTLAELLGQQRLRPSAYYYARHVIGDQVYQHRDALFGEKFLEQWGHNAAIRTGWWFDLEPISGGGIAYVIKVPFWLGDLRTMSKKGWLNWLRNQSMAWGLNRSLDIYTARVRDWKSQAAAGQYLADARLAQAYYMWKQNTRDNRERAAWMFLKVLAHAAGELRENPEQQLAYQRTLAAVNQLFQAAGGVDELGACRGSAVLVPRWLNQPARQLYIQLWGDGLNLKPGSQHFRHRSLGTVDSSA